ncbi:SWC4, partial [Symbiodinium sp. KB8]
MWPFVTLDGLVNQPVRRAWERAVLGHAQHCGSVGDILRALAGALPAPAVLWILQRLEIAGVLTLSQPPDTSPLLQATCPQPQDLEQTTVLLREQAVLLYIKAEWGCDIAAQVLRRCSGKCDRRWHLSGNREVCVLVVVTMASGGSSKSGSAGKKKPRGVSREVFNLVGEDVLAPIVRRKRGAITRQSINAAKNKRVTKWYVLGGTGVVLQFRRALKPFTSSARRDQLTLKHWERAHAEFVDYPFAKFNRRVDIVRYTDEEYAQLCMPAAGVKVSEDQDARWPKEHTDKLFELHTIEDMKLRFYTVTVRVIDARRRGQGSYSASTVAQLKQYEHFDYDILSDQTRRKQLEAAFRRSAGQVAEEASLRAEIRAIDAALAGARTKANKAAAAAAGDRTALAAAVSLGLKKAPEGPGMDPSFAASYSAAGAGAGGAGSSAKAASSSGGSGNAFDVQAHTGVALRSEQLASVLPGYGRSSRTMKKVSALMHELGVPPAGKMVPCAAVYAAHTKLRQDTVNLFQLQRA